MPNMDKEVRQQLETILTVAKELSADHAAQAEHNHDHDWLNGWYRGRGAAYGVAAQWVQKVLDMEDAPKEDALDSVNRTLIEAIRAELS